MRQRRIITSPLGTDLRNDISVCPFLDHSFGTGGGHDIDSSNQSNPPYKRALFASSLVPFVLFPATLCRLSNPLILSCIEIFRLEIVLVEASILTSSFTPPEEP
ncbi:hypothetical protein BVRB_1g022500 [Beta vulgaris subsp. vulgaris]|nr:hypothetical protein BVRB_1g022500 [Beta vulgaris subsp. vulgaris]